MAVKDTCSGEASHLCLTIDTVQECEAHVIILPHILFCSVLCQQFVSARYYEAAMCMVPKTEERGRKEERETEAGEMDPNRANIPPDAFH